MVWGVAIKPICCFNDTELARARFTGSEAQETHQQLGSLLEHDGPGWEMHLKGLRDPQLETHPLPLAKLSGPDLGDGWRGRLA